MLPARCWCVRFRYLLQNFFWLHSLSLFWTLMLLQCISNISEHLLETIEKTFKKFLKATMAAISSVVRLHCCHHCNWLRAARTQSIQTGSEHSMAAGWNFSFSCSRVATQHVASPPPLSLLCQSVYYKVFVPQCLWRCMMCLMCPFLRGMQVSKKMFWSINVHIWMINDH